MNKAIVLPGAWSEQAENFMARLNEIQPCFFSIAIPCGSYEDSPSFLKLQSKLLAQSGAQSALIVVPKSWAKVEFMKHWQTVICNDSNDPVICSLFFADEWHEVETLLQEFLEEKVDKSPKTHLTCQYQPPYTTTLKLWADAGAEEYHPGDYFKSEILNAIAIMTGNWVYWGHGGGSYLRGYGHLEKVELLLYAPKNPLNATLWFTCSTLDAAVPENIALSWYLSGATKCLLASPDKVKTDANVALSKAWLAEAQSKQGICVAEILLKLIKQNSKEINEVLTQYYLIGNPWVCAGI
ncbi:hypothetical protein [uncultured Algoriphagus sp.]|uniref:hypothetical protein n=1 Tax=uncultured Algoriphagus sp. TaxID=417365 RepID=UPI0030ECE640